MDTKRRDKGEGSIYPTKRTDNHGNEITYWVAKYKSPKMTKPKVKYGKTEAEAKRILKAMKYDAIKNDYEEIRKISVKEYMDNWLNNIMVHKLKSTTFDSKERTLKYQVYPYIGDYQIANIRPSNVQHMIDSLVAENLSYSTIRKAYDCVNASFKLGIEKKELIENPCVGIILPENTKKKISNIEFFNDDEIEKVYNASILKYRNDVPIYRLGYAIILLIYTGLRIGELLALEWKDVDFEEKYIIVRKSAVMIKNREVGAKTKNILKMQDSTKSEHSDRIVPLSKRAIEAITKLEKINGNFKYVMSTKSGKIINPRNVSRMLEGILVRCGIESTGLHTCRHTFASMLFRKGVDVKTVSELMGHANVSITYNIYIHLIKEQKHQAINLFD